MITAILSICITVLHGIEENNGKLWDEFGRIAKIKIPDWIGRIGVLIILPWILIFLALKGYYDRETWALSLLVGMKTGDTIFSHWLLALTRKEENPGIATSFLAISEATIATIMLDHIMWPIAFAGMFVFSLTIPLLILIRKIKYGM